MAVRKAPRKSAKAKKKVLGRKAMKKVRGGRKAGKEQQEYLKVTMSDVLVSS